MSEFNILKINTIGNFDLIKYKNKSILKKQLKKINNGNFLYYWNNNDFKIYVYGFIESDDTYDINNHKLTKNGISEILENESNEIDIYGDIYIVKVDYKGNYKNIDKQEYLEFYDNHNKKNISDDSDIEEEQQEDYQEEIDYKIPNELKNEASIGSNKDELEIDDNIY